MEELIKGLGNIQLEFEADFSPGGSRHILAFENHHYSTIAAYQVNGLGPSHPGIHIIAQNRNYLQSIYQMDFTLGEPSSMEAADTRSPKTEAMAADPTSKLAAIETLFCHGVYAYSHRLRSLVVRQRLGTRGDFSLGPGEARHRLHACTRSRWHWQRRVSCMFPSGLWNLLFRQASSLWPCRLSGGRNAPEVAVVLP